MKGYDDHDTCSCVVVKLVAVNEMVDDEAVVFMYDLAITKVVDNVTVVDAMAFDEGDDDEVVDDAMGVDGVVDDGEVEDEAVDDAMEVDEVVDYAKVVDDAMGVDGAVDDAMVVYDVVDDVMVA